MLVKSYNIIFVGGGTSIVYVLIGEGEVVMVQLQYNIVDGSTDSILCWWWKWSC